MRESKELWGKNSRTIDAVNVVRFLYTGIDDTRNKRDARVWGVKLDTSGEKAGGGGGVQESQPRRRHQNRIASCDLRENVERISEK